MGRGDFGFGLCDHRFLRMAGGTEIGESCLFGGNSADRLGKSGSPDQQITGAHVLVVGNWHFSD